MSTIYRTLELLETKGIVTRTTLMGSDMAYYEVTLIHTATMQIFELWLRMLPSIPAPS